MHSSYLVLGLRQTSQHALYPLSYLPAPFFPLTSSTILLHGHLLKILWFNSGKKNLKEFHNFRYLFKIRPRIILWWLLYHCHIGLNGIFQMTMCQWEHIWRAVCKSQAERRQGMGQVNTIRELDTKCCIKNNDRKSKSWKINMSQ